MNRTRYIPSIIMLAAAFVACVTTIYFKYSTRQIMLIVLGTGVVFLVIGLFIKMLAEKYLVISTMEEIEEENQDTSESEDNVNKENKEADTIDKSGN